MFWAIVVIVFALLSIATLNPLPVILAIVMVVLGSRAEAPLVAEVKASGGNPDLPKPTSGPGCVAFLLAVILFGFLGLVALGAVGAIVGGL